MEYLEFDGLTYEVLRANPGVARFYADKKEHRFVYLLLPQRPADAEYFTAHPHHLIIFPCYRRIATDDGDFEDVYLRDEAVILQRHGRHVVYHQQDQGGYGGDELFRLTACADTHVTESFLRLRKLHLLNGQD